MRILDFIIITLLIAVLARISGTAAEDPLKTQAWEAAPSSQEDEASDEVIFTHPDEFFESLSEEDHKKFYQKSAAYWESCEASDAGVLGGYPEEVMPDVQNSRHVQIPKYLGPLLHQAHKEGRRLVAMDVGAGVGRVAKHVLQYYFHELDLLEPAKSLISEAKRRFDAQQAGEVPEGEEPLTDTFNYHNVGLQDFQPAPGRYDVIWIQGVLMYVNNADVVKFFKNIAISLKPGGVIMLKENDATSAHNSWVDWSDASMNRRADQYRDLIERGGLKIIAEDLYQGADTDLLPERMYLLQPIK